MTRTAPGPLGWPPERCALAPILPIDARPPSGPARTGRPSGFRTGPLAVPMYLLFMGCEHILLERIGHTPLLTCGPLATKTLAARG